METQINTSVDLGQDRSSLLPKLPSQYFVEKYRYLVLFFLFTSIVTVSSIQTSLSPVASSVATGYGIRAIWVVLAAVIFSAVYVPMTFVAIHMFGNMRQSIVFRVAAVVAISGGWLRMITLSTGTFLPILIGYSIISFSFPILLSSVTLICNTWLSDRERTLWIQVLGLTVPIGSIFSYLIAGFVYAGDSVDYIARTNRLLYIQNIMLSVFCGGLFIVTRDKPSTPPSSVAEEKSASSTNMSAQLKEAFKERSYLLLLAIFSLMDGAFVSFASILSLLFDHYNVPGEPPVYGSVVVAAYGGLTTVFGVLSSLIIAIVLQKTQKLLLALRISLTGVTILALCVIIFMPKLYVYVVGVTLVFLGIFLVPIIPISMNFASELTFPIAPAATNGFLLMLGQGFGAMLGLIGTPIAENDPVSLLIVYACFSLISLFLTFGMTEDLKKQAFLKKQQTA